MTGNTEATETSEAAEACRNITRRMVAGTLDTQAFIRNIWLFIYNFTSSEIAKYDQEPLLLLLQEATKVLTAEPTLVELKGKVCIMGDIQGHGDSLVTLFSLCGIPPKKRYIFLGNYAGLGFAPHETLFMLLALKVRYPKQIYLIKGSGENSEVLLAQDFVVGLHKRGLTDADAAWKQLGRCLEALPLAVLLNNSYLCVHGGIGPHLLKKRLGGLRRVSRPPKTPLDLAIAMECQWAAYRYLENSPIGDGSPVFGEREVNKFCEENHLRAIIRSRQIVPGGVLNWPERLITVWSGACFLDMFNNTAAVLILDSCAHTASIVRYKVVEEEPRSLDDFRPPGGRNSRIP